MDLDTAWSFGKVHLPFEAKRPSVAVVAGQVVLVGGYYNDPKVDEIHVGTTDEEGQLSGWEVLASIPEDMTPYAAASVPASSDRLVLYGGDAGTECQPDLRWADYDGETLGAWNNGGALPEQVGSAATLFTKEDHLIALGGASCARPGEYGGCWATSFTGAGPSSWESIPCMGAVSYPNVAATARTIHVSGLFLDDENYGNGFASARLVDGVPQEWEMGRSPASTGMANLAVAEGYLFTGPADYRSGEHTGTAVLYSDANDPFNWQYFPDLPLELHGGTMVAHNGTLYLMGGTDPGGNRLDHVFSRPICADGAEE